MLECEICGKQIEKSQYYNNVICSSECFTKHYWLERVKNKDSKRQVIAKGVVYQISDENDISGFRGFDGAKFVIHFFDGRKVFTSNLWHNGTVPDEFRDQLPDNAEFGDIQEYFEDKDAYETY
jgi:hypothetical protein